ncbi:MAG: phosphatase PAP2 family protein [Rickettsiales bacterium]|nr:phosphatase PAP2 family protein [Rickettsiales bacterium]
MGSAKAWAGNWSIEKIGDMLNVMIPAYALGKTIREPGWDGAIRLAGAYGASMATTTLLQPWVAEPRPNGGKNGFPSGHATSAFSGATFIHARYGLRQAAVPYAMAGFVAYSRVHSKWHYWHDVAAGAAIAGLYSWLLTGRESSGKTLVVSGDTSGARLDFNIKF